MRDLLSMCACKYSRYKTKTLIKNWKSLYSTHTLGWTISSSLNRGRWGTCSAILAIRLTWWSTIGWLRTRKLALNFKFLSLQRSKRWLKTQQKDRSTHQVPLTFTSHQNVWRSVTSPHRSQAPTNANLLHFRPKIRMPSRWLYLWTFCQKLRR